VAGAFSFEWILMREEGQAHKIRLLLVITLQIRIITTEQQIGGRRS